MLFKFVEIESGTFKYIGAPIIGMRKIRIEKSVFLTHPTVQVLTLTRTGLDPNPYRS